MRAKRWSPALLLLAAAALASATAAVASPAANGDRAWTTPDGKPLNTHYRKQEEIATTDPGAEENIPGLEATNYKKVWRSIPDVEHMSPFITAGLPMLPGMSAITNALNMHFPLAWPLAGHGVEKKDYLTTSFRIYGQALMGRGPKPPVHGTILIPSHEAVAKLAQDMKTYSGLPNITAVHDPAKAAVMAVAVHHQLLSNLVVVAAPNLTTAVNGTVMMTRGKVKLTLLVKPDGSRFLVSNTTTSKLLAMDLGCQKCGALTFNIIDNFVVPKMSATLPKPDPLFTTEDLQRLPQEMKELAAAWAAMPKAAWDMPGAMWGMVERQLPQHQQDALHKLAKKLRPKLPLSVNVTRINNSGSRP